MAAGLGFKDFVTGEVLTAADVDGYLMQGIWVFASNAARDAAVTSPQEGNFAFTKDTNSLWYYDGAAWVASGATGDIEGVTAGIGISGGGTSGTVTVTNSMATAIDAKGDLVAGTGADTFAKLTVGANNTVLTADSAEATGLKWATPASGGGMTLINTGGTSLSGSSVTISSIPSTYVDLHLYIVSPVFDATAQGYNIQFRFNSDTASNYATTDTTLYRASFGSTAINLGGEQGSGSNGTVNAIIPFYAQTGMYKSCRAITSGVNSFSSGVITSTTTTGFYNQTGAITSISLAIAAGSFTSGTAYLYGVK